MQTSTQVSQISHDKQKPTSAKITDALDLGLSLYLRLENWAFGLVVDMSFGETSKAGLANFFQMMKRTLI